MFAVAIPLLAFVVVLVIALVVSHRRLLHPSVLLSAEYVTIAVFGIIYVVMNDAGASFPKDAVWSTTLLALLISSSIVPSLLIKKPNLDLGLIRKHVGRWTFGLAAIVGAAGFLSLLPAFIASFSIDAYSTKTLGESAFFAGSAFTIVGTFVGAISCVFGLLLFSDTRFELGWIVRLGLLAGFLNYGVIMECNKNRVAISYYLFYFLFYIWLFGHKWQRKMKVFFHRLLIFTLSLAALATTVMTVQRFSRADVLSISILDGTLGYLGQQVSTFIEVAEEPDALQGHSQIAFPIYYFCVTGNWVDEGQLLLERSRAVEWTFSTYVGALFLAMGRQWAIATILVLSVVAGVFFGGPTTRSPGAYVVGIMLYYQSLFQGAFYWMQIGRFGNGFIIIMICLIVTLYFKWPGRRGVRIAA